MKNQQSIYGFILREDFEKSNVIARSPCYSGDAAIPLPRTTLLQQVGIATVVEPHHALAMTPSEFELLQSPLQWIAAAQSPIKMARISTMEQAADAPKKILTPNGRPEYYDYSQSRQRSGPGVHLFNINQTWRTS